MNDDLIDIRVYAKIPILIQINNGMKKDGALIEANGITVINHERNITAKLFFLQEQNTHVYRNQLLNMPSEDFYGEYTFSMVCVVFRDKDAIAINSIYNSEKDGLDALAKISSEFIIRFIDIYRVETRKYWISIPTYKRLSPYQIQINKIPQDTFLNTSNNYVLDYRGTGEMLNSFIQEDTYKNIKNELLKNGKIIDTVNFLIEANKYKQIGDYKSFVLFYAFYIESWVVREIRNIFIILEYDSKKIDSLFTNNNNRYKTTISIIRDFINDKKEFEKLQNSKVYKEYRKEIAERRNSLAHGKWVVLNEDKAEELIKLGINYRDFLFENYINVEYKKNQTNKNR